MKEIKNSNFSNRPICRGMPHILWQMARSYMLKEHALYVDYVHCAAHALNLILNDAAKRVFLQRQFFSIIWKKYIVFFGNSIKRW